MSRVGKGRKSDGQLMGAKNKEIEEEEGVQSEIPAKSFVFTGGSRSPVLERSRAEPIFERSSLSVVNRDKWRNRRGKCMVVDFY